MGNLADDPRLNDVPIDEFERLRRLVPVAADRHLYNWGLWRRGERLTEGYPDHSAGLENLGGVSSPDASTHVYEREYERLANICDVIIDDLDLLHRTVISQVYEAAVWRARRPIDSLLIEAAAVFWQRAVRKGLV